MTKILIVDDEPATVDLLSHYLGRNGYQTIQAFIATEALIRVNTSHPDLLVLDIMMPEQDGFLFFRNFVTPCLVMKNYL